MDQRSKTMLIVTILLFSVLSIKSIWIDPARAVDANEGHYKSFAQEIAPDLHKSILLKTGLLTYRITSVTKVNEEGKTGVKYINKTGETYEGELKGQYSAKARVYVLYILPYKDFKIEGGL